MWFLKKMKSAVEVRDDTERPTHAAEDTRVTEDAQVVEDENLRGDAAVATQESPSERQEDTVMAVETVEVVEVVEVVEDAPRKVDVFSKKKWKQVCRENNVKTVEELRELNDRREQAILDLVYGAGVRTLTKQRSGLDDTVAE